MSASPVSAGGSVDLTNNGGNRPYLQWNAGTSGGLPRQTILEVFVNAGEEVNFGSSTHTSYTNPQDIVFRYWDGAATVTSSCDVVDGGFGHIENRAEELAGPLTIASPGGYEPCTFVAPTTGIIEVEFHAPAFNTGPNNPPALPVGADFPTDGTTRRTVAAWDVTVHETAAPDAITLNGRVFTNMLVLDMGANNVSLNSIIYVLTYDGYIYRVNMNGIDPYAVNIFADTKGLRDAATGAPIYRSMQLVGTNPGSVETPQSGIEVESPLTPDNPPSYDHTHKLFFRLPDPNLPPTTTLPDGSTEWLLSPPAPPPLINNFRFIGAEGTPGQMDPTMGGSFFFDSLSTGSYSVAVDLDNNGNYNDPIDRIFTGNTIIGSNEIMWDGLDGLGNPLVVTGPFMIDVRALTFAGEVHFPFSDPENNPNGLIIERIVGPPPGTTIPEPAPDLVYFNDTYNYDGTNTYDYSLCAQGEAPNPPDLPINVANPRCYGNPPAVRDARDGVNSLPNGAHEWTSLFGDRRIMDTWTYFPSNELLVLDMVDVQQADLAIDKQVTPTQVNPGGSVTFTLTVINRGPSNVTGATVTDGLPPEFINITWTCAVTGTGACTAAGAGNINDTVDLNADPAVNFLTYTITAQVDPNAALGDLTNVARVDPPNDVDDPNPNDNEDGSTVTVTNTPQIADLAIDKQVTPTQVNPGGSVTFTLQVINRGPADVAGATVTDGLPPEFININWTCVVTGAGACTAAGTGNINDTVTLAANPAVNFLTYTITAEVDPNAPLGDVTNVARVDPPTGVDDPTPEDNEDGSTVTVGDDPPQSADLAIDKQVSPSFVEPGGSVTFTLVVINKGPDNVTGATVTDGLPPEFINVNWACVVTGAGSCTATGTGSINDVIDLNAGPSQNFLTYFITAEVDANAPLGDVTNVARVDPPTGVDDPTPEDNEDGGTVTITNDPPIPGDPNDPNNDPPFDPNSPNVVKVANPAVVAPGDTVTWTIVVTNPFDVPIINVNVSDTIPSELAVVDASATAGTVTINGQTVVLQLDTLLGGDTVTLTITTQVRAATSAGIVQNVAFLDWPGAPDPVPRDRAQIIVAQSLPNTGEGSPMRAALPTAIIIMLAGMTLVMAGQVVQRR